MTNLTLSSNHGNARCSTKGAPAATPLLPRRRRRQRGAGMIEFALVFIFLLSLTLGLMEFARLIWSYHTLVHATREGLRVAMIRGTENPVLGGEILTNTISTAVKSKAVAVGLDAAKITVTPSWPDGILRGGRVQIESRYNFGFVTGSFISSGGQLQLVSNAQSILLN